MAFYIDTNIWVAALRGRAPQVMERMLRHDPREIVVPHQVLAELRVGAGKSARPEHHDRQVSLILEPFATVWPNEAALACYVEIRMELERAGRSISEADLWIAAMTRAADGVLVTHNTSEFQRVPGLKLEDWLSP